MAQVPECIVCLQAYDECLHVPRLLGCGHSFCEVCLKRLASSSARSSDAVIRCPECTHQTRVPAGGQQSLPKNIELLRLLPSLIREETDEATDHSTITDDGPGSVEIKLQQWTINDPPSASENSGFNLRSSFHGDKLSAGSILSSGESLVSNSGEYTFTNQEDGNLWLYHEDGYSRWHSGTLGKGRGDFTLLTDGNMVLFDTEGSGNPIWASMSQGKTRMGRPHSGPYELIMQDDGNLVVYGAHGEATWAFWGDISSGLFTSVAGKAEMPSVVTWLRTGDTLVSSNGKYTFVNQADGNLCIYNEDGKATWASETWNKGAGNLYMQRDGDLVLYNTESDVECLGAPIWCSGTGRRGSGPYKLIMQDDGKLVIYDTNSKPIWASNAGAVWRSYTSSELHAGRTLRSGESLVSTSKVYTFVNQNDGNLVTYDDRNGQATWASGTGPGRITRGDFKFLTDGNLVLFDSEGTGKPIWASMSQGTSRDVGPYKLCMQDDGNLVIYGANHEATWATRTLDSTSGVFSNVTGGYEMPSIITWLGTSDKLVSRNGLYSFVNQADGNLVIYNHKGRAMWASGTCRKGAGNLYMQRDGNLVLYNTDGIVGSPGKVIWSSGTFGRGTGPYKLILQDEGDLVIYDAFHQIIWSTQKLAIRTESDTLSSGCILRINKKLLSRNSMYTFVNQGDGNLVIYASPGGRAIWASGTNNRGVGNLHMQLDGNLVLYNKDVGGLLSWLVPRTPIWSSGGKKGNGPHKLVMQDDGNLVIYDTYHRATWASNTVM